MFVGRETLLQELSGLFNEGPANVSLYGAPGIGKSSLALELVRSIVCEHLWIDAHDAGKDTLLELLARRVGCDPSCVLEELKGKVVVFDDALPEVLPTLGQWHQEGLSLIATHRPRGDAHGVARDVVPLSDAESVGVLEGRLREQGITNVESASLQWIARVLDGHALSLTVAAGLLTVMSPEELVQRLVHYDPKMGLSDHVEDLLAAVIERLSDEARLALIDLSTLHRVFSIEDAECVIDAPSGVVLDLVVQLRNEALLTRTAEGMRLLTPIRMFVRRRAFMKPDLQRRREAAKERHYEHFVGKALRDPEALSKQFVDVRSALLRENDDPRRVLAIAKQGPVFARTIGASAVLETLRDSHTGKLVGSLDETRQRAGGWAVLLRAEAMQRLGEDFEVELGRLAPSAAEPAFAVRLNMLRAIAASAAGDPLGILASVSAESTFRERIARGEALRMVGRHPEALSVYHTLRAVAVTPGPSPGLPV